MSLTDSSTMLNRLIGNTRALIASGYYDSMVQETSEVSLTSATTSGSKVASLKEAIMKSRGIIAEIKFASPSGFKSSLLPSPKTVRELAQGFTAAGAKGISVLTEPLFFRGHLNFLRVTVKSTRIPVLMKDFIIHSSQLEAASRIGTSAILLIKKVFNDEESMLALITKARELGLEVLLEVDNAMDYCWAMNTDADIIGINNRDLTTFHVNRRKSIQLLKEHGKKQPVMALSGYSNPNEIIEVFNAGADAILIGTSLMAQPRPVKSLQKLILQLNQHQIH